MNRILLMIITFLTLTSCSLQKEFYENGNIKAKGKETSQLRNGKWKLFYESGNLGHMGKYLNGKEIGEWKTFHENGRLKQIGKFNDGKFSSEWHFFHSNGNREGIGTFINGKMNGTWLWYHTNGKINVEVLYEQGKLKRIISCVDGNGNKLDKGSFIEGNGTRKLYDIDGNLIETQLFKNGELIK